MKNKCDQEIERELLRLYYEWQKIGYPANRIYQTFMPHCKRYKGGVAAIRDVILFNTQGLARLREEKRLDLAVEQLVLDQRWKHCFTDRDRNLAGENLNRFSK